jgi:hypothetical protein
LGEDLEKQPGSPVNISGAKKSLGKSKGIVYPPEFKINLPGTVGFYGLRDQRGFRN